jgi:starch-binding outer membrane protein, SusD/RagB family
MRAINGINSHLPHFIFQGFSILLCLGCNKLVQIPNPISSITADQTFSSDATATAAVLGIYSYMSTPNNPSFSNFLTTFYLGESADELRDATAGNEMYDHFLSNSLNALNDGSSASGAFWQPAYYDIYCANAVVSGVQSSSGVSSATRQQLTGEAKFIRAFCYFYLTNLYGDIPLVLTTDFNQTVLLAKTPQAKIYQQIISDLQDAKSLLISDFSLTNGQPIRANKWAATALLARVYLFQRNWAGADSAATAVINSGQFSLLDSLNEVFLANSKESILQLQTLNAYPYATQEGYFFSAQNFNCWLTSQLMSAFEPNDQRRVYWVDSANYGDVYYFPNKYQSSTATSATIAENYTLLRLGEQYLIRAEAEANGAGSGASAAIQDLDTIRDRAGLPNLSATTAGDSLTAAIQQEWRIEFFAEWGHRWLDLKRWGSAIQVLDTIPYKMGRIDPTQLLYPISILELQTDPNLVQNPGYQGL